MELRIGSWGLRTGGWELGAWYLELRIGSWGSQEESETDAVDVRGKSSQTALLQIDTHKGSGSLGGLWGLGAGSWGMGIGGLELEAWYLELRIGLGAGEVRRKVKPTQWM